MNFFSFELFPFWDDGDLLIEIFSVFQTFSYRKITEIVLKELIMIFDYFNQ